MPDIEFNRRTYIDFYVGVLPAEDLFPAAELFPSETRAYNDVVIASGSLSLEQILSEDAFRVGQANASKFEAQVFNIFDVTNKMIQVYQLEGNDPNTRRNVFKGYIDSCISDDNAQYRDIVAYDALQYNRSLNISQWWNSWRLSNPHATLQDLLEALLDIVRLEYHVRDGEIEDLPNYDMEIYSGFTLNMKRWGDMLEDCLQLLCVCGHIDGDGELELIRFNPASKEEIDIRGLYELGNTTYENYNTAPISGIQIMDTTGTLKYIGDLTENPYTINTMLCSGKTSEELQEICENIYEEIKDVSFRPAEIKMIVSDFDLKVGDIVRTEKGVSYVLENAFSGVAFVEQTITAKSEEYNNQVTKEESETDFNTSTISIPQYYLSSSEEELEDGEWSDECPTFEDGKFYWTRQRTVLPNGVANYSDPVLANGLTEANQLAKTHSSEITQLSTEISAKVSEEGGDIHSFGWKLFASGFHIYNNDEDIFSITAANGLSMKGSATITGGSFNVSTNGEQDSRINLQYVNTLLSTPVTFNGSLAANLLEFERTGAADSTSSMTASRFRIEGSQGFAEVQGNHIYIAESLSSPLAQLHHSQGSGELILNGSAGQLYLRAMVIANICASFPANVRINGTVYPTSLSELKTNFEKLKNALDIVDRTDIFRYELKNELKDGHKEHYGAVIGEDFKCADEIISYQKDSIDLYSMVGILWQAVKELKEVINVR